MRRPPLVDLLLAGVLLAAGLAEIWMPFASRQGQGSALVSTVGVAVLAPALALRRTHPLPVAGVVLLGWPALWLVGPPYVLFYGQLVVIGVAVYSVARWGAGRSPFIGAGLAALTLATANTLVPQLRGAGEIAFDWGAAVLAWGAGYGLQVYQRRAAESLQRAIEVEVEAASRTMAALVEERTRIARELHDIVAHWVSMMVVQAGAAEQVVEDDPAYVARALATIRGTGTSALGEMRRVVTMLRDVDGASLAPQPGVGELAALVEQAREGGLEVALEVSGEPRPRTVGLDLAAYRIVQEALTNVRRHAAASRVCVRLGYLEEELRVEVEDDGHGGSGNTVVGGGHGLVGMRERASIYGGRLETSTGTGQRGFVVRAVLPAAP